MAKLPNTKREEFARLLATGMTQSQAYKKAGYTPTSGAASRLANTPEIAKRVEYHRKKIAKDVRKVMENTADLEAWGGLARQGITPSWIAQGYVTIYKRALEAQKFNDAIKAVESIVRLIKLEQDAETKTEEPGEKIAVKDTLALLGGLKDVMNPSAARPVSDARRDLLQYRAGRGE